MACSKLLSFASIVHGRDANVRITDDGLADVVDTVMVVTGKNCNHSNELLRNLKPSLFNNEKFVMRSGRKYLSLRDTISLIMVLPGKMAKEMRSQFASIIEKHIELCTDPTTGTTSVKINPDPVEDHDSRRKRIRREDLELVKLEQEVQDMRVKNFQNGMALMTQIRPDWMQTDARFRMQIEDMAKNIMTMPVTSARLTNGEQPDSKQASLSISQLAQELGCKRLRHSDACRAGAMTVKRYRELHGQDPPKHRQWVDGAERLVNSYTEADRDLLTGVLTDMGLVPGSATGSVTSDE
jgi:hypothetical protein